MNETVLLRYLRIEQHATERQAARRRLTVVERTTDDRRHGPPDHGTEPEAA